MTTAHNRFKAALRTGKLQIGLWQCMASALSAELCAGAGFDWLLFDGEHAPNSIPRLVEQLQAVQGYEVAAVARLPAADATLIKQYLDIGLSTLLVPFIETPEQARLVVQSSRYPPEGTRGVASGLVRASRWGRIQNYLATATAETCILAQVETTLGLENVEAIAQVPGVDGVLFGPADLAADMGLLGEPGNEKVVAAIEGGIARVVATGTSAGVFTTDAGLARRYIERGCTFVAVGSDVSVLAQGVDRLARAFDGREERPVVRVTA